MILVAVIALVALVVIAWLASSSLRTDRAITLDQQSRAALASNDVGTAYSKARWAYVLAPRSERAVSLGALAYVRGDYHGALRAFSELRDEDASALRDQAVVGAAAAAAQLGNDQDFRVADKLKDPKDEQLQLALARASINIADLDRARTLLENERPTNQNVAFAKAVGQSRRDLVAARQTVADAGAGLGFSKLSFTDPAYERFIREVVFVPDGALGQLGKTLERMTGTQSQVSRKVMMAGQLLEAGEPVAAERLAQSAVGEQPDYRDGWNVLAAAQLDLGDTKDARKSLKVSVDLDDSFGYTWYLKSELAEQTGNQRDADEFRQRSELLGYKK